MKTLGNIAIGAWSIAALGLLLLCGVGVYKTWPRSQPKPSAQVGAISHPCPPRKFCTAKPIEGTVYTDNDGNVIQICFTYGGKTACTDYGAQ